MGRRKKRAPKVTSRQNRRHVSKEKRGMLSSIRAKLAAKPVRLSHLSRT